MYPVLLIENLYKNYRLGSVGYGTLYQDLQRVWARWRKRPDPNRRLHPPSTDTSNSPEIVSALEDVSFQVKQGEILGIIGSNGAGKSTLLKIITRLTAPTQGRVKVRGRIGSLLEVGTGFHHELTGRENIYLSGAILGMTREEINRKFDSIVDFSGVAQYIDTPVKRYSSGMTVRLGFSVAAHLEPEILLVDEVLAVGDAEFQRRCQIRMEELVANGMTILLVSHRMAAIKSLCNRCVVLDKGKLAYDGPTDGAISLYLEKAMGKAAEGTLAMKSWPPKPHLPAQLLEARMVDGQGQVTNSVRYQDPFEIHLKVVVNCRSYDYYMYMHVIDNSGSYIFVSTDSDLGESPLAGSEPDIFHFRVPLPARLLKPGTYECGIQIASKNGHPVDAHNRLFVFRVVDTDSYRSNQPSGYRTAVAVAPEIPWHWKASDEPR